MTSNRAIRVGVIGIALLSPSVAFAQPDPGAIDYITDNDRVLESRVQQGGARLELANGDEAALTVQRS